MKNQKNKLVLKTVTANDPPTSAEYDEVLVSVTDGEKGKGGGLYGISPGHPDAVFLLSEGKLTAKSDGAVVLTCNVKGGFAKVSKNTVTVVTEKIIEFM